MADFNCDSCKHYDWYNNKCRKWDCVIDFRSVHNCWEPFECKWEMTVFSE